MGIRNHKLKGLQRAVKEKNVCLKDFFISQPKHILLRQFFEHPKHMLKPGAQWLSGRVLDSRPAIITVSKFQPWFVWRAIA